MLCYDELITSIVTLLKQKQGLKVIYYFYMPLSLHHETQGSIYRVKYIYGIYQTPELLSFSPVAAL